MKINIITLDSLINKIKLRQPIKCKNTYIIFNFNNIQNTIWNNNKKICGTGYYLNNEDCKTYKYYIDKINTNNYMFSIIVSNIVFEIGEFKINNNINHQDDCEIKIKLNCDINFFN